MVDGIDVRVDAILHEGMNENSSVGSILDDQITYLERTEGMLIEMLEFIDDEPIDPDVKDALEEVRERMQSIRTFKLERGF